MSSSLLLAFHFPAFYQFQPSYPGWNPSDINLIIHCRHRFWAHPSSQADLVFKVWAEPQGLDKSFDEKFIRNLIGYQRDCKMANMAPSVFQLMLICYDCATLATPPFWTPLWLLSSIQYILAYWIGGRFLGCVWLSRLIEPLSCTNIVPIIDISHLILSTIRSLETRRRCNHYVRPIERILLE